MLKQDGSGLPIAYTDFRVGLDVGIFGRSIRIYDCDQYTREFFEVSYICENCFIILTLYIEFGLNLSFTLISTWWQFCQSSDQDS